MEKLIYSIPQKYIRRILGMNLDRDVVNFKKYIMYSTDNMIKLYNKKYDIDD